ncbi:MAG: recombinase RecA [Alphaproteobacteria bacterium]|nr:recombinase RecA [Alphaproteobacteria bacterium]
MTDKKNNSLDAVLKRVEREFGKDALVTLGKWQEGSEIPVISTGSLGLDLATGVNGIPKGRIMEVYGPESSGKTTLCLHMIAESQKKGGRAAFIDAEHALSPKYAQSIGVDLDELLFSQPDSGEQALEIASVLVQSGAVDIVVIDSVAALTPKSEIAGEVGETQIGAQARLMSHALRKLASSIQKSGSCVIFINQIRMKIGVMFGSPETTSGGNALKFYSSLRFDIRRISSIKDKDAAIGNMVRVKIVKNKMAAPFKTAEFEIIYGEGISRSGEVITLGADLGIIEKAGSWYSYKGKQIGQGKESVRAFLEADPDLMQEIEKAIKEKYVPDNS